MKLTKLAVLLAGTALSASVLAATDTMYKLEGDVFFGGSKPHYNVDETKPAMQSAVRFGDENDTSWLTPHSKPAFSGRIAARGNQLGLPNDLDEQAVALGNATHGSSLFASKANATGAE